MRRLLLHFAAFALLVVTPAFALVPADSLAGVSISCRDARSGETLLELRAQRLDSLGAIVANWADGSARACVGMQDVATSFATDGTGGAFVVWVDMRTGEADLWIQHFTALGEPSPGWSESRPRAPGTADRRAAGRVCQLGRCGWRHCGLAGLRIRSDGRHSCAARVGWWPESFRGRR